MMLYAVYVSPTAFVNHLASYGLRYSRLFYGMGSQSIDY